MFSAFASVEGKRILLSSKNLVPVKSRYRKTARNQAHIEGVLFFWLKIFIREGGSADSWRYAVVGKMTFLGGKNAILRGKNAIFLRKI